MTPQNYIDFKRERELGDILTDTFKFLRYNFKPLSQVMLKVVGPALIVMVLALIGYNFLVIGGSKNIFTVLSSGGSVADGYGQFSLVIVGGVLFIALISVAFYAVFFAAINYSIQSYITHQGEIVIAEVAENVRKSWISFFGLTFLSGLMVLFGLLLCFIPGVYLYVPLSLVFSIAAFRNMSVGESISYSFKLVRGNWWITFLTLFVMGIIFYLASSIFQLPMIIYTLIKSFAIAKEGALSGAQVLDIYNWPYLIFYVIGIVGRILMYVVLIVSSVFIYFNLNEKKNQTGAFETIEQLGENN